MHASAATSHQDDLYGRVLHTRRLWLVLVIAAGLLGVAIGFGERSSDSSEALGLTWQVHASFVSIGFAGLTIAFQILTDPPLVIGSARTSIIEHVRFYPMLLLGIGSNLLIGLAAILSDSKLVMWLTVALLLLPSLIAIGWAFRRLAKLYSSPIQIEELTLQTLERAVDNAAGDIAAKQDAEAAFRAELDPNRGLFTRGDLRTVDSRQDRKITYLGRPGMIAVKFGPLAHATDFLSYEAIRSYPGGMGSIGVAERPGIYLSVRPGARAEAGTLIAQIRYPDHVSDACVEVTERLIRAAFPVVPDDPDTPSAAFLSETSSLQDGVLQAIEDGLAERARRGRRYYERILNYLPFSGHESAFLEETRTRLERQLWEIDYSAAQRSRRFAMDADDAALRRAIAAVRAADLPTLRSALFTFTTIWEGLLESQIAGARNAREHLLVSLQNLTELTIPHTPATDHIKLQAAEEAIWTFVALAKASIDADDPASLSRVLGYHSGLYRFASDDMSSVEPEIYAGSIVLLAWILYYEEVRGGFTHIKASMIQPEQRQAIDLYSIADRLDRDTRDGQWRNWERSDNFPLKAYRLQIDDFAARAILFFLARGLIPAPPPPSTLGEANTLRWLVNHTEGAMQAWLAADYEPSLLTTVIEQLTTALEAWNETARQNLWETEIDPERLEQFNRAVRETFTAKHRLNRLLKSVPQSDQSTTQGIRVALSNVPKDYFVDVPGVYANPADLGTALARSALDRLDEVVVDLCLTNGQDQACTLAELHEVLAQITRPMRSPLLIVAGFSQILETLGVAGDAYTATINSRPLAINPIYGVLEDGQALIIDLDRSLNVDLTSHSDDPDRPLVVKAVPPSVAATGPAVVSVTGAMDLTWFVQSDPAITILTVTDAEW